MTNNVPFKLCHFYESRLKLTIPELALFLYCFKMPSLFAFYSCHRARKKKRARKRNRDKEREREREKF